MPTTDCATDLELAELQSDDSQTGAARQPPGTSKSLKGLLLGFAATVTIGLALASWYVSVRIVSADEVASSSATISAPVTSSPAPGPSPIATANSAEDKSIAEAYWYTVPPADLYLQAAGIGPKQDASFVTSLRAKGLRAQVQAGDRADNARILIGPFTTHVEMEEAQRRLQSAGVLAIETAH